MNRRNFVAATAGAGLALPSFAAASKQSIFEMQWFRVRRDQEGQSGRTSEFLSKQWLPAAQRAGAGPIGLFSAGIAEDSPFFMALTSYPSLAGMEDVQAKLAADKDFQTAWDQYNSRPGLPYMGKEVSLLRAFNYMPAIEVPPTEPGRASRIFELRVYQSANDATLERKVEMFAEGEIALFRKNGVLPVFFGVTIAGQKMPNITYMVAFDNLAAREEGWAAFGRDPGWPKLSGLPKYSDRGLTTQVSNSILQPLSASPIR